MRLSNTPISIRQATSRTIRTSATDAPPTNGRSAASNTAPTDHCARLAWVSSGARVATPNQNGAYSTAAISTLAALHSVSDRQRLAATRPTTTTRANGATINLTSNPNVAATSAAPENFRKNQNVSSTNGTVSRSLCRRTIPSTRTTGFHAKNSAFSRKLQSFGSISTTFAVIRRLT